MSKFNYKTGGAELGQGLMMAGGVGVTMIASNQLLDFRKVFKDMYAKNPDAGWIKHQGAIKFGVGGSALFIHAALTNKKIHPLLKALYIGLMLQGGFQEARMLTTGSDGTPSPLEQLGKDGSGANLEDLDALMRDAANGNMNGLRIDNSTGIGQEDKRQDSVDLMQNATTGIGYAWDILPQRFA